MECKVASSGGRCWGCNCGCPDTSREGPAHDFRRSDSTCQDLESLLPVMLFFFLPLHEETRVNAGWKLERQVQWMVAHVYVIVLYYKRFINIVQAIPLRDLSSGLEEASVNSLVRMASHLKPDQTRATVCVRTSVFKLISNLSHLSELLKKDIQSLSGIVTLLDR